MLSIGHMEIEQKSKQYSKKNPMGHFVWDEQKMILYVLPSNTAIVSPSISVVSTLESIYRQTVYFETKFILK